MNLRFPLPITLLCAAGMLGLFPLTSAHAAPPAPVAKTTLVVKTAPVKTNAVRTAGAIWAVIVGIEYDGDHHLNFTLSDAERFRRFLKAPPDHTILLTDRSPLPPGSRRATKANILAALKEIAAKTAPNDTLWFYFSGHGKFLQADQASYLIPADVRRLDATTALAAGEVRTLVSDARNCKAHAKILVLDACESGSTKVWREGPPSASPYLPLEGVVTFAAARPDRSAIETSNDPVHGGIFTYYLCCGMAGAEREAAAPNISLKDLQRYVVAKVNALCQRIQREEQEPVFLLGASAADPEHVLVGQYDPEKLKDLNAAGADALHGKDVQNRPVLEPGVIVVLGKDSTPGVKESDLAGLRGKLIEAGAPILAEETAAEFLETLRDPKRDAEAQKQAERLGARLLLRVTIIQEMYETVGAFSCHMNYRAEFVNVYGRNPESFIGGINKGKGRAGDAYQAALTSCSEEMAKKITDDLKNLLAPRSP